MSESACQQCGKHEDTTGARVMFCGDVCQWKSMRSPLRAAFEDGDREAFFEALKARSTITESGCWIWAGRVMKKASRTYPYTRWGARYVAMHRASLEMKQGTPLGKEPAHHVCAQSTCVNPEHLQAVTQAENLAEMMARRAYLARIEELEAALAHLDPLHPLLRCSATA